LNTQAERIPQTTGLEAIHTGEGFSIAITGMLIVFFALAIISLFIRLLPVVLAWLEPILPKLESHAATERVPVHSPQGDQAKLAAAIGYVLHTEMSKAAQSKK
jgi:oxaloacetate decarboxylase gamma subunit